MTPQEHYHNEAEIVAWSEVTINGWKINITARQGATSQAIVLQVLELGEALKTLRERYGAQPYANGCNTKAANTALAAATPAPGPHPTPDDEAWNAMQSATQDPAVQAALARAKQNGYPPAGERPQPQPQPQQAPDWCPIHGCQMKAHTKDGNTWYSHKDAGGTWCRGKAKTPPSMGY